MRARDRRDQPALLLGAEGMPYLSLSFSFMSLNAGMSATLKRLGDVGGAGGRGDRVSPSSSTDGGCEE